MISGTRCGASNKKDEAESRYRPAVGNSSVSGSGSVSSRTGRFGLLQVRCGQPVRHFSSSSLFLFFPPLYFSPFFLSFLSSAISFSFMISYRLYRPPFPFSFCFPSGIPVVHFIPLLWKVFKRCFFLTRDPDVTRNVSVKISFLDIVHAIISINCVLGFREILEVFCRYW